MMNMISGFKCLPTLAGNSTQILNTFMSKFSIQTNMSQALQAQGIKCIVNFPGYFAHQPFKYQIQGIPFTNEAEAQQFMKDKITWAYDAISKWSDDDQEFHLSRGKILDGFFQVSAGFDAHVLYYFKDLKVLLKKHLEPTPALPKPTVDVTAFCNQIKANIAKTYPLAMQYFDSKIARPIPEQADIHDILDIKENIEQTYGSVMLHFATLYSTNGCQKQVNT